jgi:hypothetical protein
MDLISRCALRVAKVVWRPGHGGFAFTAVCKATFELRPEVSPLAATQEPVVEGDVYAGQGGGPALASEMVPFKKRPEVLVVGHAYAPEGRPVQALVARLVVGEIDKAIQVVGDRGFGPEGWLGEPEAFWRMPLVWERAAGGPGTYNPVGRPLGEAARADRFGRVPAPNLLPAGMMLRSRGEFVPPVGFGPIAPLWPSRAACLQRHAAGWDPSRWHERPLPDDIDLGYLNAAPTDQQRALPFGEEGIYLENLHPRFARLSTRLAPVVPVATVDHGAGPQALQLRCDTLVIDTDRGLAMLVWRAHVLLDHPDRPGRVVVTGPAAPEAESAAWSGDPSDGTATVTAEAFMPLSAALPFSDAAAHAPSSAPPRASAGANAASVTGWHAVHPRAGATPSQIVDHALERTQSPGLALSTAVLPFGSSQGESAPGRESQPVASPAVLPFIPSSASEPGNGPPIAHSLNSPDVTPSLATGGPGVVRWSSPPETQPPHAPSSPWAALAKPAPVFAPMPAAAAGPLTSYVPLSPASAAPSSTYLPSTAASAAPYVPAESTAVHPAPRLAPPPPPASEPPVPPPLLGAIASVPEERSETWDTEQNPPKKAGAPEGPAPAVQPDPEVAFDAYSVERCGAIAARLAYDDAEASELLQAEDLDTARWQRVHQHWLVRIHDQAARGRTKLLSDYDRAYVSSLEARRGSIVLEEYTRLAEAAERNSVVGALAEHGLPEGAWPHIHRAWIARMVKDVRLAKQVRAGIDALHTVDGDSRN